jgi:SAM-dependent methyltransferase
MDLAAIERESKRRMLEGEGDHMIHYALQSERFTKLPRVEPALSARAYVETGAIPADAEARLKAFSRTEPYEERHVYFRTVAEDEAQVEQHYRRSMRFLYEKEWVSRSKHGAARRDYVAGLYQTRAHSTDSRPEADYAIHAGLAAVRDLAPGTRVRRVLLIGPGMEIAPRTALDEAGPPQSHQPYVLADTLIRLGLAAPELLEIDCADVNPRVVRWIREFPSSNRRLRIRVAGGDDEWNAFFAGLGARAGKRLPDEWIEIGEAVARRVSAFEMNILTERVEPAGSYDLAVATNVLLYFDARQTRLALAGAASALRPGGYLVHNDTRAVIEEAGRKAGLETVHARMVRLGAGSGRELYDAAVIQVKK